jgi:hypothetical protein
VDRPIPRLVDVAVQVEFKADRKEPLGDLVRRVAAQFERAGMHPDIVATFSDGPDGIRPTSAVERAIRKHPHLVRFERHDAPLVGAALPPIRRLTNSDPSNVFPMADLLALADGVPRSLPFHAVSLHFAHADFGRGVGFPPGLAPLTGITITDGWWVNGRTRSLSAFYSLKADPASKKLPGPRGAIANRLERWRHCGRAGANVRSRNRSGGGSGAGMVRSRTLIIASGVRLTDRLVAIQCGPRTFTEKSSICARFGRDWELGRLRPTTTNPGLDRRRR